MLSVLIIIFEILVSLCFHQCQYALSLDYNGGRYHGDSIPNIFVDQSGKGNFTKVQDAVNSIPANNKYWVRIVVRAGVYNEKVFIPREKQFVLLEGAGREITVIQSAGAQGGGTETYDKIATFSWLASNFVARKITFKNIHDQSSNFIQAPAAYISGTRAAFFDCGFISVQDTLTDSNGRHYFENCYIEGAVDFIWGDGQSYYKGCTINVTYGLARGNNVAYITAQARGSVNDPSGFVFVECSIIGNVGTIYLGRAYRENSRVLFYNSRFTTPIAPEGWSQWNARNVNDIIFAEEGSSGTATDRSKRVWWEKRLSQAEVAYLVNVDTFINRDKWLYNLPSPFLA